MLLLVAFVLAGCLGASASYALEPQPLQFANTIKMVQSSPKAVDSVFIQEETKPTSIGKMKLFGNPQTVKLIVSSIKAKTNRIEADQKKYLDDVEQKHGAKARKEAEEKLARYQLLGMDSQGLDYRTFSNKINANPQGATQELLNRIDAVRAKDLSQEDYDILSEVSDIQFTSVTGLSMGELIDVLSQDAGQPVIQGESLWLL